MRAVQEFIRQIDPANLDTDVVLSQPTRHATGTAPFNEMAQPAHLTGMVVSVLPGSSPHRPAHMDLDQAIT
jgi:hypothetical protein